MLLTLPGNEIVLGTQEKLEVRIKTNSTMVGYKWEGRR